MVCKACGGKGYVEYWDDPSPAGVSLSPGGMMFTESCPECTKDDVCPQCGHKGSDEYPIARAKDEFDCYYTCDRCGYVDRCPVCGEVWEAVVEDGVGIMRCACGWEKAGFAFEDALVRETFWDEEA